MTVPVKIPTTIIIKTGRKPGLVDSKLDSRSKGRGFQSHPILDGNGVKTMPVPNPGSFND